MAEILLPPLKGINEGVPSDRQPELTSPDMNNVRGIDIQEKRIKVGQRPGHDKKYEQQISGVASPVVAVNSVSFIESP